MAKTLEAHARGVDSGAQTERDAFVAFLKGELLPHAKGEERHLYVLVDTLVREHGKPTATMMVDHATIRTHFGVFIETELLARLSCRTLPGSAIMTYRRTT